MNCKVSIIVPAYNAAKYLKKCIGSVQAQTYSNWELIIIDDGSTDETLSIVLEYSQKDARICTLSQSNHGVGAARNNGLRHASGIYVNFLDADDYLLPNALDVFYNQYKQTDVQLILANTIYIDKGKQNIGLKEQSAFFSTDEKIKLPGLWSYAFLLDVIKCQGLSFVEGLMYSEDKIFLYEYYSVVRTAKYIDTPVYMYRVNPYSVCRRKNEVRKGSHNLWAAHCLKLLAEHIRENRPVLANVINEEYLFTLRISFYLFGKQKMTRRNFLEFRNMYRKYYGNTFSARRYFYRQLFAQFFKYRKEMLYSWLYKILIEQR